MTPDDMMKSYGPSRLIRTELSTLIGLTAKGEISFELPKPQTFQSLADRSEALLEELHSALNGPLMASFNPEAIAAGINPFTQADVLREPIFYGGESAYSFQYRDFALRRYSRDTHRLSSINEFAILGYHLKQNLWVEDNMDFVMIAEEFAVDLDVAMTVRREGIPGEATPKGILTRLQNTSVARLIRSIEKAAEPSLIDLGFLLLTLNEGSLRTLASGVDQVTRQTRSDGKCHDVTVGFDDGKTGITVHCSLDTNDEAAMRLLGHCRLRKYVQKADSWYGLVVRAEDGLPKLGVKLDHVWEQDSDLDRLTTGMNKIRSAARNGRMIKPAKPGRNEPCPCGSGAKYKRCCLN
jgi:hypothetical protein